MSRIRIVVVDDHPLVRKGIRSLLSNHLDIEVVGEAEDGAAAIEQVNRCRPDVVLLDIKMPGLSGIEVIRQLQRLQPEVKVIVLTTYDDDEYVTGALEAGAHGYLLKNVSHEALAGTIRSVQSGERQISPELVGQVLRQFADLAQAQTQHAAGLSAEELRLVRLIAEGHSNKAIAETMFWSETTAKRKVQEVFVKLSVENRVQAAAEAGRRGLL